ncbi:MAG: two-component system, OmpR family, aerobic respiration control sensor histidine kinase ArcB [Pseudomonadota bacterium]|nr:two-component system, OmpR family, aerobic respiration control sensor histidine kinase ArcB [Pseudomonadota bacterium]
MNKNSKIHKIMMSPQKPQYKFSDIEIIGNSYSIIPTSLVVLSSTLHIKYVNSYAKLVLGWGDANFINAVLSDMCMSLNLPSLVDPLTLKVNSGSICMGCYTKVWQLIPIIIDAEEWFFLVDKDANSIEEISNTLSNKFEKITGQTVQEIKNPVWYFDEVYYWIESIILQMPGYIYCKDSNHRYIFCNNNVVHILGLNNRNEILGKTDNDLNWNNTRVDKYKKIEHEIIKSGKPKLGIEESIIMKDGRTLHLLVNKMPLRNKLGEIIGIIAINIDIGDHKEAELLKIEKEQTKKIFEHLNFMAQMVPAPFYWLDLEGRFAGVNESTLEAVGVKKKNEIVGKTMYEFYKNKEVADDLQQKMDKVIKTGKKIRIEDKIIDVTTGKFRYYMATRAPLYDYNQNIIGIIGTSIEVTAEKEAELLRVENEKHRIHAEEQEKFVKDVGQMVHDIRSPFATLKTIAQTADELPEQKRVTLRRALINAEDITNHMLNRYKPKSSILTENNQRQYVLVALILLEIASDRRYRYQNTKIEFNLEIVTPQINNFVFIQIEPSNLRRMLSNLINNAVEALPNECGRVTLELKSNDEWVEINIMDNGTGIPFETLYEMRQKIGVKTTKDGGFGIGLTQVFDTLEHNYGEFDIYSSTDDTNHGTTVSVKFPKAKAPNWLANEISITPEDIIVIVDDDISIHGAWDSRINYITEKFSNIEVKHFMEGKDALEFIDALPNKEMVYLLSDYELINQDINGIDIIKQSKVKRAVLVTSHFENADVRKLASKLGIPILPKELFNSIPLKVQRPKYKPGEMANVHIIFVDDEPEVVEGLIADHYSHLIVDYYPNPIELLKEIDRYSKETKIIMDNNYQSGNERCPISGFRLSELLHEKGYNNLYLYSWETCIVPEYVRFILKTDKEAMANLDKL